MLCDLCVYREHCMSAVCDRCWCHLNMSPLILSQFLSKMTASFPTSGICHLNRLRRSISFSSVVLGIGMFIGACFPAKDGCWCSEDAKPSRTVRTSSIIRTFRLMPCHSAIFARDSAVPPPTLPCHIQPCYYRVVQLNVTPEIEVF